MPSADWTIAGKTTSARVLSLRYTENKAHSAELLRLALGRMAQHEAAFNPVTFAVWYELVAGINPLLQAAVDRLQAEGGALDDAAIARLYQQHVAPPDEATIERIGGRMQRVMNSVAQSVMQAGDSAGSFGAQLTGLSVALLGSGDAAQPTPQLTAVLTGMAAMKTSIQSLQQRVAEGREEIDRLRNDLERARGEALIDSLSGVLNRRGFDLRLQAMIRRPTLPQREHCLVLVDIDHFKQVNDAHGHVTGDLVIRGVGEVLRAVVTDAGHVPARYGGEEFAILMPETTVDRAAQVAEAVRQQIGAIRVRERRTQEVLLTVTVSCGVAALRTGEEGTAWVARADAALYRSKKLGRDRVTIG